MDKEDRLFFDDNESDLESETCDNEYHNVV